MRSSQHQPHSSIRSPEISGGIRRPSSNDRVVARSFAGTLGASEFPIVDAQARYSISYVPGMSEHMVNTGKTLPEAQLKVVLFACEVERLNTLNYNLVKENEILKAQNTKSNREEDLETKLAIVLAENEKLNQIVEELQAVYSRERESLANEDYERRIAELLHEAEDWKNRYKKLEVSGPPSGDRHSIEDLQRERDHLREQLGRQGRDVDALRARLEAFQVGGPADIRLLQEQITNLKIENEKQRSELHAMKLKYGNADALQQSLHQYESRVRVLLDENDKLNRLLTEKTREMQASQHTREINVVHRPEEKVVKAVASPSPSHGNKELIERLTRDNEELRSLLAQSQSASQGHHELRDKTNRLAAENDRLNSLVIELRTEAEHLRRQVTEGHGVGNKRAEQLTVQINTLLEENKRLNSLLESKAREEDFRTKSAQLISENDRLNKLVLDLRADNEHLRKHATDHGRIDQLTSQLNALLAENTKINDVLRHRVEEIEVLKSRTRELELSSGSVADLKNKINALVTENDRLNRLVTDLSTDNDRLKRHSADTTRITELTAQVNNLLAENTRLNDLLLVRVKEIETLRQSSSGINELRASVHTLRTENDRLKHQISDLEVGSSRVHQLTTQINSLLEENKKLNHLLSERADTEVLRRRVTELETSIASLRSENERLVIQVRESGHGRERIEQLTQQINSLLTENQRLNTLLVEKHDHSHKVADLTSQINGLVAENKRLNELLTQRSSEIDSLRRRITEIDSSSTVISELRSKLSLTASENERLNHLLSDNRAEIDRLRVQVAEASRSSHLSGQLNTLLSENTRLNELLIQKSGEVETLRRKGIEADELRSRVSVITSENERLKITINEQRAEIDRLKVQSHDTGRVHELSAHVSGLSDENRKLSRRVQEAEAGAGAATDLRIQLSGLTEENRRLNALLTEKSAEIERLRHQAIDTRSQELTIQLSKLQDENRRQNSLILERTSELDSLRRRLVEAESHGGKARIDQLTVQINTLLAENTRLTESLSNRIREVEELRARSTTTNIVSVSSGDVNSLRATLVVLAAENERLNALVEQSKTSRVSVSVDESSTLRSTVHHLTTELDEARRKVLEAQIASSQAEDLKKKIQTLTLDSQSFHGLLKDKTTEIDNLRTKVYTLEAASRETETLRQRIVELESTHSHGHGHGHSDAEGARSAFVLLSAENDRLKAELAKAGGHHEPVQHNITIAGDIGALEVLAADNDRIGRELEIVRRALHDKETEVESLKKRLTIDQNAELRNRVESLLTENERLNNYLLERQREIESLRASIGGKSTETTFEVHRHDEGAKKAARPEGSHGDVVIHHYDIEAIEDVVKLRSIIAERTREVEELRRRTQETDFLRQENERITRLLSEKLREIEEFGKRSPTPSTAVTTTTGTERPEEVELLRKRIAELEAAAQEHSEKHHHGIFAAVKEKIAHGIEKLTGHHEHGEQGEHGDLEGEYAKLLDAQISEVSARFDQERQEFQRTEENLNLKIQQLEESLNLVTSEKDKLSAANEKSKQEIDNWKRRYEHFESQKDMEMDALKLDLEKKYRESPSRKGVPEQVIDLEDRVTYLNNEIERLQDHLNMTLTELEEWRKRYSELEVLRAQEIDELRQQFDNSKKSSIEAKEIQIKFNAERTAYEAQILQLQQKVGDVQNEVKVLTTENEKLEKLSLTRLEELEDARRTQGGSTGLASSHTLEITQLKTQIESYKAASHNVKQLAIKYSAEKAADLSQIRQLKQINENYKSELEKLYELLDERKADFESLTKQNEELLKMYEKIVSSTTEKGIDVRASQDKLKSSFTPKELSEMESTKEQYMKNSIELTRKNKELVDKLQELDILKMKYEEALANYQALNARLFEKLNAER